MERKRRICCRVLALLLPLAVSCQQLAGLNTEDEVEVCVIVGDAQVRSVDPDEDKLSDLSVLAYDEYGLLEESVWLTGLKSVSSCSVKMKLLKGKKYDFYVAANTAVPVRESRLENLLKKKFYMAYPDEYREGIPMAGRKCGVIPSNSQAVTIPLERLMAKISLRMDRRALDNDVSMMVERVTIGNCPKSALMFSESRVCDGEECFNVGFFKDSYGVEPLNVDDNISKTISLYMLENMQGKFDGSGEKVFEPRDPRRRVCSYIEMEMSYISATKYSSTPLIYRFYLGENDRSLDVERNCHYLVTVRPSKDGLGAVGWRIDKSGINDYNETDFIVHPGRLLQAKVGEKLHVYCELMPSNAPFNIGLEELEEDRKRGIYTYEIDEDGHGVVLTMQNEGSGLLYFEAGAPIDKAAMVVLVVEGYMNS